MVISGWEAGAIMGSYGVMQNTSQCRDSEQIWWIFLSEGCPLMYRYRLRGKLNIYTDDNHCTRQYLRIPFPYLNRIARMNLQLTVKT